MGKSQLPRIGIGTFGSDTYGAENVSDAVALALRAGYRLFDCASVYGNEDRIGQVFAEAIGEGVCRREDMFVISKVWNDMHGEGQVLRSIEKSLSDLGLGYVDAYFLHWPFPNYHAPGCGGDERNPDSVPFSTGRFMAAWRQIEEATDRGLARYAGMSNMTIPKLEAVLPLCRVRPALIEMELHPAFQQPGLFDYCVARGIQPVGFCPIGSPARPTRDRAPGDIVDTEMPEIVKIAEAHGIHPALVCLKWSAQRGALPIPFSVKEPQIIANLASVYEDPLTDEEMRAIGAADRDCRLVKGQVFLWEGARGWEDLWDLDGTIAGSAL
ncbi:MAG: aldo/keto reductase [Clostridiales Family XIII bacterium]|nr:aldo/keto reductase [Clostridiales Family XIII bacterium]